MTELPADRKNRFAGEYGVSGSQADFLIEEKARADFFEEVVRNGADPASAAVWLTGDVTKMLNKYGFSIDDSPLTPLRLAEMLLLLATEKIPWKNRETGA